MPGRWGLKVWAEFPLSPEAWARPRPLLFTCGIASPGLEGNRCGRSQRRKDREEGEKALGRTLSFPEGP